MWKRKTEEDYKKNNALSNFSRGNLIVAVLLAVFAVFVIATYGFVLNFAAGIIFFVIIFALICLGILLFNDPSFFASFFILGSAIPTIQTDICNKCFSAVQSTDNKICKCSGKYEPLEDWKWVEDKEQNEQVH